MELNRVFRDCDEKEILTPRQRAVGVRLLAAGGRLHHVVANEAKQLVDLDIWRGSGCDRPGLLVYFVMSASSAISMRCRAMMPLGASKNVCLTRMRAGASRTTRSHLSRLTRSMGRRTCAVTGPS